MVAIIIVVVVRHYVRYNNFIQIILLTMYNSFYVRHYSYSHSTDGKIEAQTCK